MTYETQAINNTELNTLKEAPIKTHDRSANHVHKSYQCTQYLRNVNVRFPTLCTNLRTRTAHHRSVHRNDVSHDVQIVRRAAVEPPPALLGQSLEGVGDDRGAIGAGDVPREVTAIAST